MRQWVRGMPCVLLAAFLLFARLIAPAAAMPAGLVAPIDQLARSALCHDSPTNDHSPVPAEHGCLLCPACHLFSHVVLPVAHGPVLPFPPNSLIERGIVPRPTTGRLVRPRPVAEPTGPPCSD